MKFITILIIMVILSTSQNLFAKTKPDFTTGSATAKASDYEIKLCPYCNQNYKEYKIMTETTHVIRVDTEIANFETCWTEIIRVLKTMGINSSN